MASICFTPNLERHLPCPQQQVEGFTVRQALYKVFVNNPKLEGYILDDQGRLRKHVVVFIDGQMIKDRLELSDPLQPESEIFVAQALSGG